MSGPAILNQSSKAWLRRREATTRSSRSARAGNINDPGDDRPLRLPDVQSVNAQVTVDLEPLTRVRLETFVDVLNVLALRTTTSVGEINGQDFGVPRDREQPFRFRLGLRYRY